MKNKTIKQTAARIAALLLFMVATSGAFSRDNITISLNDGTKFEMIWVDGGTFTMGVPKSERAYSVWPAHRVTVSGFYIGKFEVTNKQWRAVTGKSLKSDRGSNYPAAEMTWYEATHFIMKLNEMTGKNFRLPTEAEWEYAAQGGRKSRHYRYSGSNDLNEVAWNYNDHDDNLHPVGLKKPNELGIYDMSGNADEWCYDWKGDFTTVPQTNPKGPRYKYDVRQKVIKGGEIRTLLCETFARSFQTPTVPNWHTSFRLVLSDDNNAYNKDVLYGQLVEMVYLPKGTFKMGASKASWDEATEPGGDLLDLLAYPDKWYPVHQVTVSGFYLNRFETSQALWEAVMGYNNSSTIDPMLPVDNVSWKEANFFCKRLSELTGKKFRLPTEAEWEYAARRNESMTVEKMGAQTTRGQLQHLSKYSYKFFGMMGNVSEWCKDWVGDYPSAAQINPKGPASGSYKVTRGGCFLTPDYLISEHYRKRMKPVVEEGLGSDTFYQGCGFRIAMSAN